MSWLNSAAMNSTSVCIFSDCGFLCVYAQEWDCWDHMVALFLMLNESSYCCPEWLYQYTFSSTVWEGSLFSALTPAFTAYRFFDDGHFDGVR